MLRCAVCGKEWSSTIARPGDRCGVRISGKYWCDGLLAVHEGEALTAKLAEARALLEAMRDRAHVCNGGGCKLGLSETLRWLAANPGTEGK